MIRRRERFPYEWQIALSGALLVGMSTVLPSTPFSGLLTLWSQWIGEPLAGWHLASAYGGLVFLPPITALALAYPLLVLSDQVLGRPWHFSFLARIASVLLLFLAGMAIADAVLTVGMSLKIGQIVISCGVGILFVVLGIGLHGQSGCTSKGGCREGVGVWFRNPALGLVRLQQLRPVAWRADPGARVFLALSSQAGQRTCQRSGGRTTFSEAGVHV